MQVTKALQNSKLEVVGRPVLFENQLNSCEQQQQFYYYYYYYYSHYSHHHDASDNYNITIFRYATDQ
jgi:hypothetical protein